jgi:hypothetical protein
MPSCVTARVQNPIRIVEHRMRALALSVVAISQRTLSVEELVELHGRF